MSEHIERRGILTCTDRVFIFVFCTLYILYIPIYIG